MVRRYSARKDYASQNASWQGVNLSSSGPQPYSGIDNLKNMSIQDDHIYVSVSQQQHSMIASGQPLPTDRYPALSGYFTDEATASRHFDGDSRYSAVGLAGDLQQNPYYDPDAAMQAAMDGKEYFPQFNGNLDCFTIDRDRLEAVYGTRDLNAAVGKCTANDHLGCGGGNQGFNSDLTELYNNGCLKYDPARSRTSEDVVCRDYDAMQSRAEARTQDCFARHERTPSPEVCAQTSMGPANTVQSQPFHSTEVQKSAYYTGMHERLNDPNLFQDNAPSDYQYVKTIYGKSAEGVLGNTSGQRNLSAQRTVGGEDRRSTDDGGHLIGTRFQGSGDMENLEPQDRNLNRGSYKQMENRWAAAQDAGDKVFVHSESFHSDQSQRPEAFMGYAIYEHPDGTREWEAFSYQNESSSTQQEWNDALNQFDPKGLYLDNSLNPRDYNPADYEAELNDMDSPEQSRPPVGTTPDQHQDENQEQAQDENQEQAQDENQEQAQDENQEQPQDENQEQAQDENREQAQDENQEQAQDENQEQAQDENQEQAQDENQEQAQDENQEQTQDENQEQAQDENQEQDQDKSQEQAQDENQEQAQDENQEQAQDENQEQAQDENQEQAQDENQEQAQDENQEQVQDENQEQAQTDDLSMDQAAERESQEEQAQTDDLSMDQAAEQAPQEEQTQSDDLSMDQAAEQAPEQEQTQTGDLSMDQAAEQAPQEEQAQTGDLSMDQAAEQAPEQEQTQSDDLSMDQAAEQAPEQEQTQSDDLSMDQAAEQAPEQEQTQSDDLSMDQAAGEDASAAQEQDSSGGEEQSSGQEEDQSQGYSY